MRNPLSALIKLAAIGFAILFVISTASLLPAFLTARQLTNPEFYKQALQDQEIYTRFPELAGEQFVTAVRNDPCARNRSDPRCRGKLSLGTLPFLKNLKADDWQAILTNLVPATWFQTQAESLIDQFFAYMNGDAPTLTLTLSMSEPKARIRGQEGYDAVMRILKAQPECDLFDYIDLFFGLLDEGLAGIPSCRPDNDLIAEFTPEIRLMLADLSDEIPEQYDLAPVLADFISAEDTDPLGSLRQEVKLTRQGLALSLLLPLACFGLMTVLGVRSVQGWLLWWGAPLTAAGLAMLVNALLFPSLGQLLIGRWVISKVTLGVSQGIALASVEIVGALFSELAGGIILLAVVTTMVGLMLLAGGGLLFLLRPKER